MKSIIVEQAAERKMQECMIRAVEQQSKFAEKMAFLHQQRRIETARVAAMTKESDARAIRSQKVIDAKRDFARKRGEMSRLATVKRASLSAKAEIPRGGDFNPLAWMTRPLVVENQAAVSSPQQLDWLERRLWDDVACVGRDWLRHRSAVGGRRTCLRSRSSNRGRWGASRRRAPAARCSDE